MTQANTTRENIIQKVNNLSEEKLSVVESFLDKISKENNLSEIEMIYKKAVERYDETLRKLAQ